MKTNVNWYIWRPVMRKIATLHEVQYKWTIDDLADAHELLDIQEEIEYEETKKIKQQRGKY